ncbi:MAG: IS200/IS605 family transposase [Acidobacteria bacterium]|nr:IS200/IS605 family transposase [Acidobacteriota bacterium]
MSTYTQLLVHFVFGPYRREPVLWRDGRAALFRYITGVVQNHHCKMLQINGVEDHLHFFAGMSPAVAVAHLVKDVKLASSDWLKETGTLPKFSGWQDGYAAFSVSPAQKDAVIDYIRRQEEHHGKMTYLDEYWQLLQDAGIFVQKEWLER